MTDEVNGGGLPSATNPPAGGGPASGAGAKGNTVVYRGLEGRRFGSYELEVGDETWTFPVDREVKDVPQAVVDALGDGDGNHNFEISKGA